MNAQMTALDRERAITTLLIDNMRGHWSHVMPRILPELAPAIDAGPRKHITCPYHGGIGDFRIHKNFDDNGGCVCTCNKNMTDGFKVIMYARGIGFMQAKQLVIDALGGRLTTDHVPVAKRPEVDPVKLAAKDAAIKSRIERTWQASVVLSNFKGRPVRNWLATRRVGEFLNLPTVRCHPFLGYWEWNDDSNKLERLGSYPAMIAMVQRPDGKTATLHRTWLARDGKTKAPVPEARKLESSPSTHVLRGAAIRLDHFPHPVLSLGEGIETALSARLLTEDLGIPAWSTINSVLLEQVEVPDYVQIVVIWADRDRSQAGQAAAIALCKRLRSEGKRVVVMLPPYAIPADKKGVDWNDVVLLEGVEVARSHPQFQQFRRRLKEVLLELNHPEHARRI